MNATQEDLNRSVRVTAPSLLVAEPASAGTEKPSWEIAAPERSGPHHATGPKAGNANRSLGGIDLSGMPEPPSVLATSNASLPGDERCQHRGRFAKQGSKQKLRGVNPLAGNLHVADDGWRSQEFQAT